ncbi:hypothetical protein XELAEV_18010442mg [Xenopus laevis]|uniref:Uncharacterized protein n=1 Tax=Xenopus laevis TaxID=8355 RepID=A0A974DWE8_XENLA|nr:hypothetical protein XELAEV_18010442mg [Xenopus laevis]
MYVMGYSWLLCIIIQYMTKDFYKAKEEFLFIVHPKQIPGEEYYLLNIKVHSLQYFPCRVRMGYAME